MLTQKDANIWKHIIAYTVFPFLNTIQYLKNIHKVSNSRCYIILAHLIIQFPLHVAFMENYLAKSSYLISLNFMLVQVSGSI